MFKAICDQFQYPAWASERYKRLDLLDKMLDGKIYDHIQHCWTDEKTGNNTYLKITERRPAVQLNQAKTNAKAMARKLFGGRHAPKISHDDEKVRGAVEALIQEAQLLKKMMQAVFWGSVGAVGISFGVLKRADGTGKVVAKVWRAKWCLPVINRFEELEGFRIQYTGPGHALLYSGFKTDYKGDAIQSDKVYWYTQDLTTDREITYKPIPEKDYNPLDPNTDSRLQILEEFPHPIGFVPAHWFENMAGETHDGESTWADAASTMIWTDILESQVGRGIKYSCGPQLVIKGQPGNYADGADGKTIIRGPVSYIQLQADVKESDGSGVSGSDAYLLEMKGDGLEKSDAHLDGLINKTQLQIGASRKDPETINGQMSGKALELIDEEHLDLKEELKTSYGEDGYLVLIKKMARAAIKCKHQLMIGINEKQIDGLRLQWPKEFTLGPQELLWTVQALQAAIGTPEVPGTPGTAEKPGTPGIPAGPSLLTEDEASAYLRSQIELPIDSADQQPTEQPEPETDDKATTYPEPADGGNLPAMNIDSIYPQGRVMGRVDVPDRGR